MTVENATHTPGKWLCYGGHDGQFQDEPRILAEQERGPDICVALVCDNGSQQTDANARLLAAAPALLAEAQGLLIEIEAMHLAGVHDFNALRNGERFSRLRAATNLAKGRWA